MVLWGKHGGCCTFKNDSRSVNQLIDVHAPCVFQIFIDNGALSLRAGEATTATFFRHLFLSLREIYAGNHCFNCEMKRSTSAVGNSLSLPGGLSLTFTITVRVARSTKMNCP